MGALGHASAPQRPGANGTRHAYPSFSTVPISGVFGGLPLGLVPDSQVPVLDLQYRPNLSLLRLLSERRCNQHVDTFVRDYAHLSSSRAWLDIAHYRLLTTTPRLRPRARATLLASRAAHLFTLRADTRAKLVADGRWICPDLWSPRLRRLCVEPALADGSHTLNVAPWAGRSKLSTPPCRRRQGRPATVRRRPCGGSLLFGVPMQSNRVY